MKNHGVQISPGPSGLCPVPEDGGRLLPGMPRGLRGLHRPLHLLQVSLPVYNLGDVPKERKEIPSRKTGKRGDGRITACKP